MVHPVHELNENLFNIIFFLSFPEQQIHKRTTPGQDQKNPHSRCRMIQNGLCQQMTLIQNILPIKLLL